MHCTVRGTLAKANSSPQTNTASEIRSVALYARVSTTREQNPEMQLRELREYAARRGWTVITEFVDHGVSDLKDTRPQLNKLMAAPSVRFWAPHRPAPPI